MALDVNEVISNSIIGVIGIVAAKVGAWISKLKTKVDKADKDLNIAFAKIRYLEEKIKILEAALGIKGVSDASQLVRANGAQIIDRDISEQGHCPDALGNK